MYLPILRSPPPHPTCAFVTWCLMKQQYNFRIECITRVQHDRQRNPLSDTRVAAVAVRNFLFHFFDVTGGIHLFRSLTQPRFHSCSAFTHIATYTHALCSNLIRLWLQSVLVLVFFCFYVFLCTSVWKQVSVYFFKYVVRNGTGCGEIRWTCAGKIICATNFHIDVDGSARSRLRAKLAIVLGLHWPFSQHGLRLEWVLRHVISTQITPSSLT